MSLNAAVHFVHLCGNSLEDSPCLFCERRSFLSAGCITFSSRSDSAADHAAKIQYLVVTTLVRARHRLTSTEEGVLKDSTTCIRKDVRSAAFNVTCLPPTLAIIDVDVIIKILKFLIFLLVPKRSISIVLCQPSPNSS